MDELITRLERLMGPRQFFTPPDLVKMGIYGSKSSVWRAVHLGYIEAIQISDRRWVILKESVIKHVKDRKREREEIQNSRYIDPHALIGESAQLITDSSPRQR